jgi:multiple sugar transport system permease protein/raffinose/stachyose/melibiose transport system permease protein
VIALVILVAVSFGPYLLMLTTSLKTNQQVADSFWAPTWPLHFENYTVAAGQILPYLGNSVLVAAVSTFLIVLISAISGFVMARYRFPARGFLFAMVLVLMMVPGISTLIPLFIMMKDFGLLNTYLVLIIPYVAGGTVLGTILMRTFIQSIPQGLFDAARVDGASGPRLFFSIMLPLSLPVIGTVGLITFNAVWNDFFWPLLTITDDSLRTVSVGLQFFQGQNVLEYGPLMAGYALASLPLLILFVFFSKYFLAGVQGGLPGAH